MTKQIHQFIIVFVTVKDKREAAKIAKRLVGNKLIACANIIDGVQSLFWWQGKIDQSKEVLLILKTKRNLFKKLEAQVKQLHSYKVPEIIALPVLVGSQDYLTWINSSVGQG